LDIEEDFEVVQLLSLFFKFASLDIVLGNLCVSILNDFLTDLLDVLWHVVLELESELANLDLEFDETRFDVTRLLGLHRQDFLLHWTKCVHAYINELSL
jgi:hypothetical protein